MVNGNDTALIVRDIIPFLFLLLPLFMMHWPVARRGTVEIVSAFIALIGIVFSARVVWPVVMGRGDFIGVGSDPLYLSIAPTISFAAVLAGVMLYKGLQVRNVMIAAGLAVLAALPLAAMVVTFSAPGWD